jgi:hypothetical protein
VEDLNSREGTQRRVIAAKRRKRYKRKRRKKGEPQTLTCSVSLRSFAAILFSLPFALYVLFAAIKELFRPSDERELIPTVTLLIATVM